MCDSFIFTGKSVLFEDEATYNGVAGGDVVLNMDGMSNNHQQQQQLIDEQVCHECRGKYILKGSGTSVDSMAPHEEHVGFALSDWECRLNELWTFYIQIIVENSLCWKLWNALGTTEGSIII